MTQLNGTDVTERHNRPGVESRVLLRALFLNDGIYQNPVEISAVSIFPANANRSPSSVLEASSGLLNGDSAPAMNFTTSNVDTTDSAFDVSNYTAGNTASGIFQLSTGQFGVVLDGIASLSGTFNGSTIANEASAVGTYIDVWTVKFTSNGSYTTVIQSFDLFDDTFYAIAEKMLLRVSTNLVTKKIPLGSKMDLKLTNRFTVENSALTDELKNIFRQSVIQAPALKIEKRVEDDETIVEVSGFSDTSGTIHTTSEDTVVWNLDTDALSNRTDIGLTRGIYFATLQFVALDQTFQTDRKAFQVI